MTVYLVGVADCESNQIISVCATKEIAEREMFKARDELVNRWKELDGDENLPNEFLHTSQIKNLLGNDYKEWDNYPFDCPYIQEFEFIEK